MSEAPLGQVGRLLVATVDQLSRVSQSLQRGVLSTRMVPVGPLFSRFRRSVRDIAAELGKVVTLELVGEKTELDKRMKAVGRVPHEFTNDLIVNYIWFTGRVRKLIQGNVVGNELRFSWFEQANGTSGSGIVALAAIGALAGKWSGIAAIYPAFVGGIGLCVSAVAAKAKKIAAGMMECMEEDLELAGGRAGAAPLGRESRRRGESEDGDRREGQARGATKRVSRGSAAPTAKVRRVMRPRMANARVIASWPRSPIGNGRTAIAR